MLVKQRPGSERLIRSKPQVLAKHSYRRKLWSHSIGSLTIIFMQEFQSSKNYNRLLLPAIMESQEPDISLSLKQLEKPNKRCERIIFRPWTRKITGPLSQRRATRWGAYCLEVVYRSQHGTMWNVKSTWVSLSWGDRDIRV